MYEHQAHKAREATSHMWCSNSGSNRNNSSISATISANRKPEKKRSEAPVGESAASSQHKDLQFGGQGAAAGPRKTFQLSCA